jgi:MFS transporter, PAT family, beta-lactamase induction signal transducer AmpG
LLGLGRALWLFGFFQIFSNLGYAAVAQAGANRPLMYAATAFELGSTGLGSGAFGVLLLRMTQKRFSATQFALFSSLFAVSRILSGPPAGVLADTIGWRNFFLLTLPTGIPGMLMLARFVPWNVREPEFEVLETQAGQPLTRPGLVARALAWGVASWGASVALVAALWGLRSVKAHFGFRFFEHVREVLQPSSLGAQFTFFGLIVVAGSAALMAAATLVARRGLAGQQTPGISPPGPP